MKNVADFLRQREQQWFELDALCREIGKRRTRYDSAKVSRFLFLYRNACSDFALADAYHLPPRSIDYLGKLVGRCHAQLYRRRRFPVRQWIRRALYQTPGQIMSDLCVHVAFFIWTVLYCASAYLAYSEIEWPDFVATLGIQDQLDDAEASFLVFQDRSWVENLEMAAFYIVNNTSIGLFCFAAGILVVPGLLLLGQNATMIGATTGYMMRPEMGESGSNFREFITAHGPFEITAIILSAGAGLRLGMSLLQTGGKTRFYSLMTTGRHALSIAACAVILFFLAALIEAFISPIPRDTMPWWIKGSVATLSSILLMIYFCALPMLAPSSLDSEEAAGVGWPSAGLDEIEY